uniref:Retinitis pigmentosa 1-like 1 protein-like n=1 Tax=Neolamprologus brichardi TaxID=32507 RepID=A0A3Q4HKC8_NEOBR
MSVSSLPEWKQLLLEKKRKEEEERERREKEEEEKFASMPAWKRGIIQRRKAKQEYVDSFVTVSVETIVPVHENPFILTQSAWRKSKDGETGNEPEVTERDKLSPRSQDGELERGRDIELKKERFRDLSEGREKDRSRDRSQGRERENSREGCEKEKSQLKDRIYNLETVGSRSGLYLRDRTVDISSSVHLVKVKPIISNSQQGDNKAFTGDDISGVQTIQQQIEQFQLKEQEAQNSSSNTSLKDRETKGQQRVLKQQRKDDFRTQQIKDDLKAHQIKDDVKTQEKDQETPDLNPKVSPHHACSPTPQAKQTITVTPSYLRTQSPDNSLKATDCAPTPASSPSSPSPAQSPSVSPSPTQTPVLFSIRSASGGQVKRGATITITPKRATGSPARPSASTSTPTAPAVTEPGKKKYPTVEEIEVIGGYQNLEKSCLVKNRGTPKKVSGNCVVTLLLCFNMSPHDLGSAERLQDEEVQEEQGDGEGGAAVVKNTRSTGTATGPRVIDVSHLPPRLRKHNV